MAVYKDIRDAVETALTNSTGVSYVSHDGSVNYRRLGVDQYPAILVRSGPEEKSRLSFLASSTAVQDMQSEFDLELRGFVRALDGTDDLDTNIAQLISDCETTLTQSTAISDLVADIVPSAPDPDTQTRRGIRGVTFGFHVMYFYNRTSP